MKTMKYLLCVACTMWMSTTVLCAKGDKKASKEEQTVYVFGVSTAFGDTLVHFTDIQTITGTELVNKGFLEYRSFYSYQLKNFMENSKNCPHQTCTVYFSDKKKKLEKTYSKLKKRYQEDRTVALRFLETQDFSFKRHGGVE